MVRLYPDIIVATAINNQINLYKKLENKVPEEINLNIGNLLGLQEDYLSFGFNETPVLGYEGLSWNVSDYEKYFEQFPEYFVCNSIGLWVVKNNIVKNFDYRKLLVHGYRLDVLEKLGL